MRAPEIENHRRTSSPSALTFEGASQLISTKTPLLERVIIDFQVFFGD